eukprot:1160847-Pelagomonas_calceolata.AAC.4
MRAKELLLARWVSGVRAMTMAKLLPAELVVVMVVVQWLRVVMHLSVRASSGAVSLPARHCQKGTSGAGEGSASSGGAARSGASLGGAARGGAVKFQAGMRGAGK